MYHDILTVSYLLYVISPKVILRFSRLHWYYSNSHKSAKTNISSFVVDPDLPATQYFIADFIYQGYYMKFKSIELPSRSLRDQIPSGAVLCRSQSSIRLKQRFPDIPCYQSAVLSVKPLPVSGTRDFSVFHIQCVLVYFLLPPFPYYMEIVDPLG